MLTFPIPAGHYYQTVTAWCDGIQHLLKTNSTGTWEKAVLDFRSL